MRQPHAHRSGPPHVLIDSAGTHRHTFQGQTLVHSHLHGAVHHGYYEHPEDGVPYGTDTRNDPDRHTLDVLVGLYNAATDASDFIMEVGGALAARGFVLMENNDGDPYYLRPEKVDA